YLLIKYMTPRERHVLSTMIASKRIAHGLYVFVLPHDLIQKLCNFLGSCSSVSVAAKTLCGDVWAFSNQSQACINSGDGNSGDGNSDGDSNRLFPARLWEPSSPPRHLHGRDSCR